MSIVFDESVMQMYVMGVQNSVTSFLPIITTVIAIFLAFAILQSTAFFIKKSVK